MSETKSASAQEPEEWRVEEAEGFKFVLDESGNILLTFPEVVEAHNAALSSLREKMHEYTAIVIKQFGGEVTGPGLHDFALNAANLIRALREKNEQLKDELHDQAATILQGMIAVEGLLNEKRQMLAVQEIANTALNTLGAKVEALREKIKALEEKEAVADRVGAVLRKNGLGDTLSFDAQILSLRAELQKAEKDKARLNWLQCHGQWHDDESRMKVIFPMPTVQCVTLRDAIDTALELKENKK